METSLAKPKGRNEPKPCHNAATQLNKLEGSTESGSTLLRERQSIPGGRRLRLRGYRRKTVSQTTVMTTLGESTVAAESLAGRYICRFCEIVRPQLINFKLAFAYNPIFAQASVRKRE
jgi:hypothetical protein